MIFRNQKLVTNLKFAETPCVPIFCTQRNICRLVFRDKFRFLFEKNEQLFAHHRRWTQKGVSYQQMGKSFEILAEEGMHGIREIIFVFSHTGKTTGNAFLGTSFRGKYCGRILGFGNKNLVCFKCPYIEFDVPFIEQIWEIWESKTRIMGLQNPMKLNIFPEKRTIFSKVNIDANCPRFNFKQKVVGSMNAHPQEESYSRHFISRKIEVWRKFTSDDGKKGKIAAFSLSYFFAEHWFCQNNKLH